jgi:hypothetical protein
MDSSDESTTFFKHVFNFDDESKSTILNILQYTILGIVPIVILNKSMQHYIPEADNKKSSLEITAEILIQVIVIFMGLFLINRIVTYVPTYSGTKYPEIDIIYVVLAVLMITLSLQTKLGEKVSILVERVSELWNGKQDKKANKKNNVKVSQPISGNQQPQQLSSQQYEGTAISSLPTEQQLPNYDNMYRQDTNPLVGAATPGITEGFADPAPANSVLGGSSFGSW